MKNNILKVKEPSFMAPFGSLTEFLTKRCERMA